MHVPGWHEATKQLQREGKLQMLGIIQEQHPDRARLFMQWKQMGWPVLVDSYNLLGVAAVPLTLAIDEHGIVRHAGLRMQQAQSVAEQFVNTAYEMPAVTSPDKARRPDFERLKRGAERSNAAAAWRAYADALAVWGGVERVSDAIAAYQRALQLDPRDAMAAFRLGVAYRIRHDSPYRQPQDFQKAVKHWSLALAMDPNQYIFRRRIQQYGPRLDKPYPFYDWVSEARREIRARGEQPAPLQVEPAGAELARPSRRFETQAIAAAEPDPEGRILRDNGEFIRLETTLVPPVVEPGQSARVHLEFRPNLENKAHWNNELDGLVVWVKPAEGWAVESRALWLPNPPEPVSQETRRLEFEIRVPEYASGRVALPAYALYYVCEDVNGLCLYRRKDIRVTVEVRRPAQLPPQAGPTP